MVMPGNRRRRNWMSLMNPNIEHAIGLVEDQNLIPRSPEYRCCINNKEIDDAPVCRSERHTRRRALALLS